MKKRLSSAAVLLAGLLIISQLASGASIKKKEEAVASIERHKAEIINLSDWIWGFAETALLETRSSKALADYAEEQGFAVERGVAGLPTAFVASYGEGRPIIGVLGEYDALPGLSQKAQPVKEAVQAGTPGHGCGHNLLGTAALGAALAVKDLMAEGKLKGTIRFYGTPAEEAVGGKVYMAREGLFKDLDVCLTWHPGDKTRVSVDGSQAIVDFIVEFSGKTAHAAGDPWNGRSAVAGLEFFTTGLNRMREFVKPTVRMHYSIMNGGDVPNVVPAYAKLWCWLRDSKGAGVDQLLSRTRRIAEGAAMMAEVESKLTVQGGDWETLVNIAGEKVMFANLTWLGPIQFTPEEQEFAKEIQRVTGVDPKGLDGAVQPWAAPKPDPEGGSTDVGDVSWIVPTLSMNATTAPVDAPWHAWPVVACGGMSIGHKGLVYAAKVLAATMVDLFEDAKTLQAIQAEFREKTKGVVYKPFIPDGPPPLPKH
ncbi:MAG: peptidase M20 [Candidatus Aminicenantes bacterium RBG_19FT_COMBO_65_30]|nr:MAG: peptidase M20 [Candidatus Aminicenantes bacterium RBG_19FT_COMBO_65_30]